MSDAVPDQWAPRRRTWRVLFFEPSRAAPTLARGWAEEPVKGRDLARLRAGGVEDQDGDTGETPVREGRASSGLLMDTCRGLSPPARPPAWGEGAALSAAERKQRVSPFLRVCVSVFVNEAGGAKEPRPFRVPRKLRPFWAEAGGAPDLGVSSAGRCRGRGGPESPQLLSGIGALPGRPARPPARPSFSSPLPPPPPLPPAPPRLLRADRDRAPGRGVGCRLWPPVQEPPSRRWCCVSSLSLSRALFSPPPPPCFFSLLCRLMEQMVCMQKGAGWGWCSSPALFPRWSQSKRIWGMFGGGLPPPLSHAQTRVKPKSALSSLQ